jgi:hypothetical protein
MDWLSCFYQFWHCYGSDIQNGAVVLSAIAAFWVIADNRKINRRRGTMDLILHQESDRELVEARGKPDRKNEPQAQIIRRVLNVHELTAVAIQERVIDECVYRRWFNTTFIKDYESMKDYISEARATYSNPKAFSEFESTAIRWKEDKTWGAPPSWIHRKWTAAVAWWRA